MPFTSADLANIDAAIATGPQKVRFSDGREIEYRSVKDLEAARALILNELSQQSGQPLRMVRVITDSGF